MNSLRIFVFYLLCAGSFGSLLAQHNTWNGYHGPASGLNLPGETVMSVTSVEQGRQYCFLLKNGFLLKGLAEEKDNHYLIRTEFGEMQIPIVNVEFVAEKMEAVYLHKRGQVDPGNFNQLMKLGEWCLNQSLTEQGLTEYARAREIAPNPVLADFITRRMESVNNPDPNQDEQYNPFAPPPSIKAGKHKGSEEDAWITGIPKPVFSMFAQKVQPILTSRCASVNCHGSNSDSAFKISIPRQTGGATTYNNLRSAIQWIDLDSPSASPLLEALISAHAGKQALFSVESNQYDTFVQWVQLAAKELPVELNEKLLAQLREKRGMGTTPVSPSPSVPVQEPVRSPYLPPGFQAAFLARQGKTPQAAPAIPQAKNASLYPENSTGTVDYQATRLLVPGTKENQAPDRPNPFDPARFNQRYHKQPNGNPDK